MNRRPVALFLILFAVVGVILLLRWQTPQSMGGSEQWLYIIYSLLWLLLIGSSGCIQRLDTNTTIKYAAIWLAIIAGLALFYDLFKGMQ